MNRSYFVGLTGLFGFTLALTLAHAAAAEAGMGLGLTASDLDRLGVVLALPETVAAVEIAAGPAEVVIPPAQQAVVSATLGGLLSRVLVAEGDAVTAGQPLAEITSAELLELQHDYIEASLAADLARAQRARDERLHGDGIIAERRVLESRAAERVAVTALNQARQQLELAGLTDQELAGLVETGELGSRLTLKAPFAGVVIEQLASLGQHVDALDPVHRIADFSTLWLELHLPQEVSDEVAAGMRVVAAAAGREIDATVIQVGRVSDSASQTVLVRARIDGVEPTLSAGQFLSARVLGNAREADQVFAVPSAAIVRGEDGTYVFAHRAGEVIAAAVQIIAESGSHAFVRGDLDREAGVAVDGVAALKSVWLSAGSEDE